MAAGEGGEEEGACGRLLLDARSPGRYCCPKSWLVYSCAVPHDTHRAEVLPWWRVCADVGADPTEPAPCLAERDYRLLE